MGFMVSVINLTLVNCGLYPLTLQYVMGVLDARYNWICQPVVYSYEPEHMRVGVHMHLHKPHPDF